MSIYRVDARALERIRALEQVRETAAAFLLALDTDPGYPMRRQEALRKALKDLPKGEIEAVPATPAPGLVTSEKKV